MKILRTGLVFFLVLLPAVGTLGQGCSLCRDATAGSAPKTRKSLRLAIPILAIPAAGLFTTILYISVTNKTKPKEER